MKDFAKSLVVDVVIAVLLASAVLFFVKPTIVKQTSMQDTLQPNDYIIMYKRAYVKEPPKRGDIVIFQSELTDEKGRAKLLIKRVIGLPGDVITIKDEQLYINGEKYKEEYIKDGITPGAIANCTVPEGRYYVLGDNRVVSVDSRYEEVGCVKLSQIKGKAVLRLFPFNKIGKL
ncbi:MAG: signal peptidase I [Clostridiales bacterium]|nr:signal peptidase I [Candidatus Crickella merdequi]